MASDPKPDPPEYEHSRPTSAQPFAQHGRLRRSRPILKALKWLLGSLAAVVVVTVAIGAIGVWSLATDIRPGVALVGHSESPSPWSPMIDAMPGAINVLVAGSDSAENDPTYGPRGENLNDVTMVLHISADHKNAVVVSIPRDLYVPIPACPDPAGGTTSAMSSQKINTSLSYGGLPCTVLTVEQLTGLSIPFAGLIQFQGLIAMSDAVGGVPVCVSTTIDDSHQPFPFVLTPGEHVLQGAEALAFLRTRYALQSGSDLARGGSQRVFLSSLFRKMTSNDTLTNPLTDYNLAHAALKNMTFSQSLTNIQTMVSIALALKNVAPDHLLLVQYPTVVADNGLLPNESAANDLFAALAADRPLVLSGGPGVGAEVAQPKASASPAPHPSSPAASAQPSPAPSSGTSAGTPAGKPLVLPPSVVGQTANQQTCSVGRPVADQ